MDGIISEPNSAFNAYLFQNMLDESKLSGAASLPAGPVNCLVVDIGGGTTDISFVLFADSMIRCLATIGKQIVLLNYLGHVPLRFHTHSPQ